ncbi:MAG TPA: M23 family metallopeptidase [Gracilimonas sp.]|uniref:M23 family metallopeptidase n=1 Tax=Gracilimonas sp. TaxID=1974203 RepID=UPI002DAD9246|nr:M23 family metallopeptidase [Gracilimonas sp.]
MGKKSIFFHIGAFLLLLTALVLSSHPVNAQDWRLSANYSIQSVGLNYVPNQTYRGDISAVSKGILEVELERYLFYRFYLAGKAEYLVQNQQDIFIGGPINFQQFNFGAVAGLQWPKVGVYGGVKAGSIWDIQIRATNFKNGYQSWVAPEEFRGQLTTGFTAGVKYYLLNFVRVFAEVNQTYNLPQNIVPQGSFTENPAFRSFDFNPVSFSVGISIGIPWNSPDKRDKGAKTNLPPLMRLSSVSFEAPLKDTYVTSEFGPRWNRPHQGVDLNAGMQDNILAVEQGVVVKAGKGTGYGKMVRIKHSDGFETVYAHMSRIRVKEGDRVKKGQVVGNAGNTGTSSGVHLHFEILKDGVHVDPQSYIRF